MATKKTAKKSGDIGQVKAAQKQFAKLAKLATATTAAGQKYATIGDVMRAKAKGALPRGAKFVIVGGRARFGVGMQTLLDVDASEVARWGLRKAGFKADHAA